MADIVPHADVDAPPTSKDERERTLERVYVTCYSPGQRVKVSDTAERQQGLTGTVISASKNAAYVNLDKYGGDPFRFDADDLIWIKESADMDAPEQYISGLDYVAPLKGIGYTVAAPFPGIHSRYRKSITNTTWTDSPHVGAGRVRIDVIASRAQNLIAQIFVEYHSGGEWETIQRIEVPFIEVMDVVREVEQICVDPEVKGVSDFARKLTEKKFPGDRVIRADHLWYKFGESVEPGAPVEDPDDAGIDPVQYAAEIIDMAPTMKALGYTEATGMFPHWFKKIPGTRMMLVAAPRPGMTWMFQRFQNIGGYQRHEETKENLSLATLRRTMQAEEERVKKQFAIDNPVEESAEEDDNIDPNAYAAEMFDSEAVLKELGYALNSNGNGHWIKVINIQGDDPFKVEVVLNHLLYSVSCHQWDPTQVPDFGTLNLHDQFEWVDRVRAAEDEDDEDAAMDSQEAFREAESLYHAETTKKGAWVFFPTSVTRRHNLPVYTLKSTLEAIEVNINFSGVTESEEVDADIDPNVYVASTFNAEALLKAYGWEKIETGRGTERAVYAKDYPIPAYQLGGLKVDKVHVRVDTDKLSDTDEYVMAFMHNAEGNGLPIAHWRLWRKAAIDSDQNSDGTTDTLRRFVSGIDAVMKDVQLPPEISGAVRAGAAIESALNRFVHELNVFGAPEIATPDALDEAAEGLGASSEDIDAPDQYIRQLGTIEHVLRLNGIEKSDMPDYTGTFPWIKNYPQEGGTSLQLYVKYMVKPGRHPDTRRYRLNVSIYPCGVDQRILWSGEEAYSTEAIAASVLGEVIHGIEDTLRGMDRPLDFKQLSKRLRYGPGMVFKRRVESIDDELTPAEIKDKLLDLPDPMHRKLEISKKTEHSLNAILHDSYASAERSNLIAWCGTVFFGDGTFMDIQVRHGQWREEDEENCYTGYAEGVLYAKNGDEIDCTEPHYDIAGEYIVGEYVAEVVISPHTPATVAESDRVDDDDDEVKRQLAALPDSVAYVKFTLSPDIEDLLEITHARILYPDLPLDKSIPQVYIDEIRKHGPPSIKDVNISVADSSFKWLTGTDLGGLTFKLRFSGLKPNAALVHAIQDVYDITGISGEFTLEDYEKSSDAAHCPGGGSRVWDDIGELGCT